MAAHKPAHPLPHITLKERPVPYKVLSIIPLATVEKYQVVAFENQDKLLKLAIVHPEALKEGFYTALKDLEKKIDKHIELSQTDSASFQALLKLYRQGAEEKESGNVPERPDSVIGIPPHFKSGQPAESEYLRRIPLEYARTYRLACVDFVAPSTYWFATDKEGFSKAQEAVQFIEKKNQITGKLLTLDTKELDDIIATYEGLVGGSAASEKPKSDEVPVAPTPPPAPAAPIEEVKPVIPVPPPVTPSAPAAPIASADDREGPAEEVLSPDLQGAILTSDPARSGIAGLFQRVSQGLHVEKPQAPAPSPVPPPLPPPSSPVPPPPAPNSEKGDADAPIPTPSSLPVAPSVPRPPAPGEAVRPAVINAGGNEEDLGRTLSKPVETLDELKEIIKRGMIPQIVAAVVSFGIHEKASDVHVEAFSDEVRVRYRIDGQLVDVIKLSTDVHAAMVSRIKILSKLRLDENRIPQDGRFDVNFLNAQVDLRVSIMPTVHGEKVVMRILEKTRGVSSLEELGIEGLAYQSLTKAINRPFGIVLATGPTGSGKSTSLYAILNRIATPNVNVVTLEDPVEYEVKGINQSQIRPKIGYTFAEGLRSILRQDPNIIMVGEIRDGETATMATQAALTGHLVLSSLHTNDASGAIPRLTNMGIEPFLIASSLNVAMGQRLVRKICHNCKSEISLPQGVKDQIARDLETVAKVSPMDAKRITHPINFSQGRGCNLCNGKGYLGRVGIYEVLNMSEKIEELTLSHASATAIQEEAQKEGMITMYQDGLLKVISGITTLDEVLRETSNK